VHSIRCGRRGRTSLRRYAIASLALGIVLCLGVPVAMASRVHYAVLGIGTDTNGVKLLTDATVARMWVYPKPTLVAPEGWVESIYDVMDTGSGVEMGWYWYPGATTPQAFVFENYTGGRGEVTFSASLPQSTWQKIELRRNASIGGTDWWQAYFNDGLVHTFANTGMASSRSIVGCERYDTADRNGGSWKYLIYRKYVGLLGTGTTYNWPSAATSPPRGGATQDPNWWLHLDKLNSAGQYNLYVNNVRP
jgi:hypothetical protein